jgi:DNA-binding transcriptional regulator YdaS (Cro superfamily)
VKLADYLQSLSTEQRSDFAQRCLTSPDYLAQLAAGIRKPKVDLAIRISKESGGQVTCEELLPDVDWAYLRSEQTAPT